MGSVWIAHHEALDSKIVVKLMLQGLADDPRNLERFSREAKAASQVRSPHVVQVFDHGLSLEGQPFIAMELLEGEDLGERIARARLGPHVLAVIISQICKALVRAHKVGILHRDIKPSNVFLCDTEPGEVFVKLLDFGIAKHLRQVSENDTTTGIGVGTPFFMSPEQLMGEKTIDHRSDLWSLGVLAFYALTGCFPFEGSNMAAVALTLHKNPMPKPSDIDRSIPSKVDAWFARACARDPQHRFQSARELSDAFSFAVGMPVSSQVPFTPEVLPEEAAAPNLPDAIDALATQTFEGSKAGKVDAEDEKTTKPRAGVAREAVEGLANATGKRSPSDAPTGNYVRAATAEGPTTSGPTSAPRLASHTPAAEPTLRSRSRLVVIGLASAALVAAAALLLMSKAREEPMAPKLDSPAASTSPDSRTSPTLSGVAPSAPDPSSSGDATTNSIPAGGRVDSGPRVPTPDAGVVKKRNAPSTHVAPSAAPVVTTSAPRPKRDEPIR